MANRISRNFPINSTTTVSIFACKNLTYYSKFCMNYFGNKHRGQFVFLRSTNVAIIAILLTEKEVGLNPAIRDYAGTQGN